MKKNLLAFLIFLFAISIGSSQVYLDQFDANNGNTFANQGMTSSFEDSEWTISADGSSGPYEVFGYTMIDNSGAAISVDMSATDKIYVRVKASSIGTQLRLDVKDEQGYVTSIDGKTKTVVNDYAVIEYSFSLYQDGGYGGSPCTSTTAPCPVDATKIRELNFFINPGQGGYQGTLVIDYISVGTEPVIGPMSDVYQDQFDDLKSLDYLAYGPGHSGSIANGIWTIVGDGTAGPYNPMEYYPYNGEINDSIDIDLTLGDNKIYIRAKGSVPGISLRCDAQDIDKFISTLGSVTKVLSDEWKTYEYDLTGFFEDLGYGGTPCDATTAPCAVDATRIGNLTFFITPGVEAFSGTVEIDYISIGTALEASDPTQNVLTYGDHFNDGILYASSDNFTVEESNSKLNIIGDGNAGPYQAISVTPFDKTTGETISIDVTGNNKIFIKGSSTNANTLVRVDLLDSDGYVTSMPALTKVFGLDEKTYEYDFSDVYIDAGYGGTTCEAGTGPCPVNAKAIAAFLLYPDPADGGFNGTLSLDFISVGAPLGEDIAQYTDEFDNDENVFGDPAGFTSVETGGEAILTGDGTAGPYAAFAYDLHDQETGVNKLVNFTFNDKLFVSAKSDVDATNLRIDVIDEDGYVANFVAVSRTLGTEYAVYEFLYTAYQDGAYGGTPCTAGPCDVDATRVKTLLVYVNPDAGGFAGNVFIDWISTQKPLVTVVDPGPKGIDDYSDHFENGNATNTSGMAGLVVEESGTITKITGDGTSGAYSPVVFGLHNQADETGVIVNATSNANKLFIYAKSSVADLPLRIDFEDNLGYVTSLAGITKNVSTDFSVIEYDFTGNYKDGGYGGTPCAAGPCNVDGERISALQMFILPGTGAFSGDLEIDWISFGESLIINIKDTENVFEARIFPNPASDQFVVFAKFSNEIQSTKINMYDMTGKLVYSSSVDVNNGALNAKINTENLDSGLYFIQASSNGQVLFNDKVIIK